jgi:hypothetical protein
LDAVAPRLALFWRVMSSDHPTDKDRIEYLVLRRYPDARLLKIPRTLSLSGQGYPDTRQLKASVAAYRAELSALSAQQLRASYTEVRNKELEALRRRADEQERALPFNQPYAAADFDHWSKAAHWTLDEAIALSFGKAPEVVTWEKVKSHVQVSQFAAQYHRRRDLALRALHWQELFDPVLPSIFLAWCKHIDIPIPAGLEASVTSRGIRLADWRKLYEETQAAAEKKGKEWAEFAQKQREDWSGLVKSRDELIATLKSRISELEDQISKSEDDRAEKPLGTRERESLLKLVIGLAMGGYGYDPKATRSEKPSEIASDLAARGLALDVDTVRKWLAQARELLPRD